MKYFKIKVIHTWRSSPTNLTLGIFYYSWAFKRVDFNNTSSNATYASDISKHYHVHEVNDSTFFPSCHYFKSLASWTFCKPVVSKKHHYFIGVNEFPWHEGHWSKWYLCDITNLAQIYLYTMLKGLLVKIFSGQLEKNSACRCPHRRLPPFC